MDQPLGWRTYRCTFKHAQHRTELTLDVRVPYYTTQPELSSDAGYAWRGAERIVEEWNGRNGIWLRDLIRMWVRQMEEQDL